MNSNSTTYRHLMNSQRHILKIGRRQFHVVIRETPQAVEFLMERRGPVFRRKHERHVRAFMFPIVQPYEADPRPSVLVNVATGERVIVCELGSLIQQPASEVA